MMVNDKGKLQSSEIDRVFMAIPCGRPGPGDAFLCTHQGQNVLLLHVSETENSFQWRRHGMDWMITVCDSDMGDARFETDYIFGHKLHIVGKADTLIEEYGQLVSMIKVPPTKILILKQKP